MALGLARFAVDTRNKVARFFMKKKDGMIRVAIDCGKVNEQPWRPLHVRLGSAMSIGDLISAMRCWILLRARSEEPTPTAVWICTLHPLMFRTLLPVLRSRVVEFICGGHYRDSG